jgi:hypothetical protein
MCAQHGWQLPGQYGQDRPVGPVRFRLADLTPEHRHLMAEHHNLRILGRLGATEQHKLAEDPDSDQVKQPKSHEWRSWRSLLIRPNRRSRTCVEF